MSGVKITQSSKYKNSKSIKNDKNKKIFTKKKTDNISNKSVHIDFKSTDKNTSLMKSCSLVLNKNNIPRNTLINTTENNYEFYLKNEIEDLTNMEKLLNQVKDYM